MATDYPHDDDGEALKRVAADGNDMSKPMPIDFTVVVPDEDSARAVAGVAAAAGYDPDIDYDGEADEWIVEATKTMLATYENVVGAQAELGALTSPHGGEVDGWGTFGNND